jgi:hypothetical protein
MFQVIATRIATISTGESPTQLLGDIGNKRLDL